MKRKAVSKRNVLFRDYPGQDGYGTEIQFRDGNRVVYIEYMGDSDYNLAIVDWILFGKYDPNRPELS